MIKSVNVCESECKKVGIFEIQEISEELKDEIRKKLTLMCYGEDKFQRNPEVYNYKKTLKHFLERYKDKPEATKKGMIGELLVHTIIGCFYEKYKVSSPLFNLEEKSIKKGFDIVFYDTENLSLWLVEVKSGEGGDKGTNQKNTDLLGVANTDMTGKLQADREALWHNAINGASIVLASGKLKDGIVSLLEGTLADVQNSGEVGPNQNVVLASVVYNQLSDKLQIDNPGKTQKELEGKSPYKEVRIISLHKSTFEKVSLFLESET